MTLNTWENKGFEWLIDKEEQRRDCYEELVDEGSSDGVGSEDSFDFLANAEFISLSSSGEGGVIFFDKSGSRPVIPL